MRNRLFRESRARNCQDVEELRRFCSLEAEKARQSRIEELSLNHEMSPSVVNQLISEIQKLQNKANSLTDGREFHDPEGSSSSGASHVLTRPLTIPTRSEKPSREPTMPNDTRNAMGISGNVFESLPAREGQSLPRFENSRNLAWSFCEMKQDTRIVEQDSRMRGDAWSSTILNPSQEGVQGPLLHTGRTYNQNGVMNCPILKRLNSQEVNTLVSTSRNPLAFGNRLRKNLENFQLHPELLRLQRSRSSHHSGTL